MKKSKELSSKLKSLRSEIEETLSENLIEVKKLYEHSNGSLDGFVELNNGYIHCQHESDGNMNEVIVGVHTCNNKVQTDCCGEISEIYLSNISNENIIGIIKDLEDLIEKPSMIEIVSENEY